MLRRVADARTGSLVKIRLVTGTGSGSHITDALAAVSLQCWLFRRANHALFWGNIVGTLSSKVCMVTIASASFFVEVRTLTEAEHLRWVAYTTAVFMFRRRLEVRGWVLAVMLILVTNTVAALIIVWSRLFTLFLQEVFVTDTLASFFVADASRPAGLEEVERTSALASVVVHFLQARTDFGGVACAATDAIFVKEDFTMFGAVSFCFFRAREQALIKFCFIGRR